MEERIIQQPLNTAPAWRKRLNKWCRSVVDNRWLYLLILPALAYLIIFNYMPMYGLQIAFRNFRTSKGITGNAIAPSMVRTEMMLAIPPAKMEAVLNAHPMHRMGDPSEVAALAAYLCSEDCSYVTGTVINCAGAECTSS